jgi:hypothetical protein
MPSTAFSTGLVFLLSLLVIVPAGPAKAYDPGRQHWKLAPYEPRPAVPPRSSHSRHEIVRERIIEHRGPGYTVEREIIYSPRPSRTHLDGHRWRDESPRRPYHDPYRGDYRDPYRGSHNHMRPDRGSPPRTPWPVSGYVGYSSNGHWHIGVQIPPVFVPVR